MIRIDVYISGPRGSGKTYIANWIRAVITQIKVATIGREIALSIHERNEPFTYNDDGEVR